MSSIISVAMSLSCDESTAAGNHLDNFATRPDGHARQWARGGGLEMAVVVTLVVETTKLDSSWMAEQSGG